MTEMPKHPRPTAEAVGRLVGPGRPELLCDECFEKLDEYVDLELDGQPADERIPGMRAHLQGCPACHEDYDSLRDFVLAEHPH